MFADIAESLGIESFSLTKGRFDFRAGHFEEQGLTVL